MAYDLIPMRAPRLAGSGLRAAVQLMESPAGRLFAATLLESAGVTRLRKLPAEDPLPSGHPLFRYSAPEPPKSAHEARLPERAPWKTHGFQFETAADFLAAFREGRSTPEKVARRLIDAFAQTEAEATPMRILVAQDEKDVLAQAAASLRRWEEQRPRPLEGVPVAIKDEVDVRGYSTRVGTRFHGETRATEDSAVVERLRAAGAVIAGKANMHEIGLGVTGLNPHYGAARNPYDLDCATGGSSSGSAAAVAAGLCPIALAADGGGSIRIPAALCGVVGLKPTYGRVSEHGAAPICWSVAHLGVIGASVHDVALGHSIISGEDPRDPSSEGHPAVRLDGIFTENLDGLRLGIFRPWFEDADPEVVQANERLVAHFKDLGAEVVEVSIDDLAVLRAAHQVTIISEMAASQAQHIERHRGDYGLDVRMTLSLQRYLGSDDYVHAQRLRPLFFRRFMAALSKADVILTPATACTAPQLPADALSTGESNLPLMDKLMRFVHAGNFAGLPAISFPAGYDSNSGLPIAMQAMGRPWEEHVLLRVAGAAERRVARRGPLVHHRLLK